VIDTGHGEHQVHCDFSDLAQLAGWEQLAQSASGLCLDPLSDHKPVMLACAATDHTTGFAMPAGIMEALDASAKPPGLSSCCPTR